MNQEIVQNVVIFGETGAGKSSLVNMILGRDEAKVSADTTGCTFDSTVYSVVIKGRLYNLHDTIGLGNLSNSRLDVNKPIGNLYNLLTLLSKTGGIHLLVFVVRCGRLTQSIHKNYTLLYQGFCNAQVSIVIVVTGCEDVEPQMETWWTRNEYFFTRAGMRFRGHACICASKGRETAYGYVNEDLVEESKGLVDDLISRYCQSNGMKKEPNDWFHTIWSFVDPFRSRGILGNILNPPARELYHAPIDSTNTHEGASPPPIEAQVDDKFAPDTGHVLVSCSRSAYTMSGYTATEEYIMSADADSAALARAQAQARYQQQQQQQAAERQPVSSDLRQCQRGDEGQDEPGAANVTVGLHVDHTQESIGRVGQAIISPYFRDGTASLTTAFPLSNSTTNEQNVLQSKVHTSFSLSPSQKGVPYSTTATAVEVGQPISEELTSSAIASAISSSIVPENRNSAISHVPTHTPSPPPKTESSFCSRTSSSSDTFSFISFPPTDPICLTDPSNTDPSPSSLPSPSVRSIVSSDKHSNSNPKPINNLGGFVPNSQWFSTFGFFGNLKP